MRPQPGVRGAPGARPPAALRRRLPRRASVPGRLLGAVPRSCRASAPPAPHHSLLQRERRPGLGGALAARGASRPWPGGPCRPQEVRTRRRTRADAARSQTGLRPAYVPPDRTLAGHQLFIACTAALASEDRADRLATPAVNASPHSVQWGIPWPSCVVRNEGAPVAGAPTVRGLPIPEGRLPRDAGKDRPPAERGPQVLRRRLVPPRHRLHGRGPLGWMGRIALLQIGAHSRNSHGRHRGPRDARQARQAPVLIEGPAPRT